jgi:ribosome biogenesis GTPase / thiamine phosphate phosphatase
MGAMLTGVVAKYHREFYWIRFADGREVIAKPRARLELAARRELRDFEKEGRIVFAQQLAVGDEVRVAEPTPGSFAIEEVLPRQTWLIRKSEGRYKQQVQCVVANADQLALVIAPNPGIALSLVDRAFIAAIQGGLKPLLVVNKLDLAPELEQDVQITNYRALGYPVFFTQAIAGLGLDALRSALAGQLTVFSGHSGVGKSTLLAALTGCAIKTAAVREYDMKGRQTTVTAELYALPGGGGVVDTPGVREYGLAHLDWTDVHEYFSDIAELTQGCGFRDCLHQSEPGCNVLAAIARGELAAARVDSYRKLRQEANQSGKYWENR